VGLVGKANGGSAAGAPDGGNDIAAMIRQAVADEIERQRIQRLEGDHDEDSTPPDDHT
jgi:hypothetical protein